MGIRQRGFYGVRCFSLVGFAYSRFNFAIVREKERRGERGEEGRGKRRGEEGRGEKEGRER